MKSIDIKNELNLQRFISNYVVANTPKYLYNHFRSNEVLFQFAKNHSISSLANNYKELVSKDERSLEDVVAAYVILVSLTFLPLPEGFKAFKKFSLSKLDWGRDIFEIYKGNSKSQNVVSLEVEHQITSEEGRQINSNEFNQSKNVENNTFRIDVGSQHV